MRLCLRLPIECSSCVIHRNAMRQNRERREARFQLIRLRRTDSDFNSYCPSNLSNSPPFFRILPRCPPISLVSWGGAENCCGRGPGYLWSPDDGKGRGSNLQPRRVPSETGHRKNKEPEPPGTTQVTRGPWRSNPPSESQSRCIWLETCRSTLPAGDRGAWSRAVFPSQAQVWIGELDVKK